MEAIISQLRKEHEVLLQTLKGIKDLGIGTPEGKTALFQAKQALLAHLQLEDTKFYPALRKAAETDEVLQGTLARFAEEMEEIGRFVMDFFTRYEQASAGMDFARDFGKMCSLLQGRIFREESVLFPAFEKIPR